MDPIARLPAAARAGMHRADRWTFLRETGAASLDLARLVEAHLDAASINAELGGPPVKPGHYWGVWAAEPPDGRVEYAREGATAVLSGVKRWCSGATVYTDALVTAHGADGPRLFAVRLDDPGVRPAEPDWAGVGMAGSDTRAVRLDAVPATPVGAARAYLDRPGFWYGAVSVAACWFGGAQAVAAPLYRAGGDARLDAHGRAHLGAVDAALAAARWALDGAGRAEWTARAEAQRTALRVRAIVERTAHTVVDRVGRALGPGPLARDAGHARRVADLTTYVRQSHAERDLATLADLADAHE